jgi:hypothetical protein
MSIRRHIGVAPASRRRIQRLDRAVLRHVVLQYVYMHMFLACAAYDDVDEAEAAQREYRVALFLLPLSLSTPR